ncbi:hypothetical protein [Frankia sp. Cppng1_Ct_nod]|uniref:hypothetical protein n=1 Tax=Frankia sp. Cppng1_Ct_nod TaxID=2897162 RepID=UPI001041A514|nr:hypothetical protein [Frankia sp. Cppng1_Ct_nod]
MPTSFMPLDHNHEIIPSSTFGLVIEVSEDVRISVFTNTEEAAGNLVLASLVTRAPVAEEDYDYDHELLSIRVGGARHSTEEGDDASAASEIQCSDG